VFYLLPLFLIVLAGSTPQVGRLRHPEHTTALPWLISGTHPRAKSIFPRNFPSPRPDSGIDLYDECHRTPQIRTMQMGQTPCKPLEKVSPRNEEGTESTPPARKEPSSTRVPALLT
jgi:hypothetical protein